MRLYVKDWPRPTELIEDGSFQLHYLTQYLPGNYLSSVNVLIPYYQNLNNPQWENGTVTFYYKARAQVNQQVTMTPSVRRMSPDLTTVYETFNYGYQIYLPGSMATFSVSWDANWSPGSQTDVLALNILFRQYAPNRSTIFGQLQLDGYTGLDIPVTAKTSKGFIMKSIF